MAEPQHNPAHVAQALANITSVFRDPNTNEVLPVAKALIEAIMQEVQELEDVFYELIYDRLLSSATNAQLDQVGELVGESRLSSNDEEYRRFIAARIAVNRSGGEPERLIYILETITGATDVQLSQAYPATILMTYFVPTSLSPTLQQRVGAMILEAISAGVALFVGEAQTTNPFAFEGFEGGAGFDEGIFASLTFAAFE